LHLATLRYGEGPRAYGGAAGRVLMHANGDATPELLADLNLLLELAALVGIGAKTSFGFGQARRGRYDGTT